MHLTLMSSHDNVLSMANHMPACTYDATAEEVLDLSYHLITALLLIVMNSTGQCAKLAHDSTFRATNMGGIVCLACKLQFTYQLATWILHFEQ